VTAKNPLQEPLYQVVVTFKGRQIPVGPRMKKDVIEECVATIKKNIIAGRERAWSDPQCVRVFTSIPAESPIVH